MRLKRLGNRRGITFIELMLYSLMTTLAMALVTQLLIRPAATTLLLRAMDQQRFAYRSMNLPIRDLKEAVGVSRPALTPGDTAFHPTEIPWFGVLDRHQSISVPSSLYVCYRYEFSERALVRYSRVGTPTNAARCAADPGDLAASVRRVVVRDVAAPTNLTPLFQLDSLTSIRHDVVMNLMLNPPLPVRIEGKDTLDALRATRRVTIRL